MGRGNVARVSMRGRWIVHDDDEDHDHHDHDHDHDDDEDEDEAAAALASVAVDDDPEETMGRETVGRKLGEAKKKTRGREEFRKNLPPFWKNLNRPCPSQRNFFEDNSIYFEREECLRTRAVFLECWQMALKFSRLVPNIQLRGRSSVSFTSRSNPPPQLAKKKLCKCRSECRKLFFLRLRDNCFLHGNRFKTWVILWIFSPQIHWCETQLGVSIAQKKIKIHTGKMPKWLIIYFAPLSIQKVKN